MESIDSIITVRHPFVKLKHSRLIPGHIYLFNDGSEYRVQLVDVCNPLDHSRQPGVMLQLKVISGSSEGHIFSTWASVDGTRCQPWEIRNLSSL